MSRNTIGDAPIEQKYREKMRALAQGIDEFLNGTLTGPRRKTGFVILMFDFGDGPSRCNYISNAERADVVKLLKEQIARFEGQAVMNGEP